MSIRRRLRLERGAELIEMALVLPLLMLVIMGIIDFGFLFREMSVVTNAAREGARAGVLPDYSADANVSNRVQQYLTASGITVTDACGPTSTQCVVTSPTIAITPTGYPSYNARDVRVTIFHQFSFLGPIATLVGGSYSSVALTGRAVMRVE